MTRTQLRRLMRERRRALSPAERRRSSVRLTRRIQCFRIFRNSQRLALYLPNDGEMDLTLLILRATQRRKRCYLPTLCPLGKRVLWFAPYRLGNPLRLGRLHIPEPIFSRAERVRARNLDLILVPVVAFDAKGNRLGMGGGYYDQTLAFLSSRRSWRKPRIVGVAYDFQQITALKPRPWDVPLDAIITETRVVFRSPA